MKKLTICVVLGLCFLAGSVCGSALSEAAEAYRVKAPSRDELLSLTRKVRSAEPEPEPEPLFFNLFAPKRRRTYKPRYYTRTAYRKPVRYSYKPKKSYTRRYYKKSSYSYH